MTVIVSGGTGASKAPQTATAANAKEFSAAVTASKTNNTNAEGDKDVQRIKTLLKDQGTFGTSRSDHVLEMKKILQDADPATAKYIIDHLSDDELKSMAGNMQSDGIGGASGLTDGERNGLFQNSAGKLNGNQLARLTKAFGSNRQSNEKSAMDFQRLAYAAGKMTSSPSEKLNYIKAMGFDSPCQAGRI